MKSLIISWVIGRLREPSTHAGIAAGLAAAAPILRPHVSEITQIVGGAATIAATAAAILLAEKK